MYNINWKEFEIKNKNYRDSFEDLAYFLFCRRFKRDTGIFRYKNQTGIETEPILVNRKWIGFQAKYFDSEINKNNLVSSIEKAKSKNPKINKIVFYINKELSESSKKEKKDAELKEEIEKTAKNLKVAIEWFVPSNFEQTLNLPANLSLLQLYFGIGYEFSFIKNSVNPDTQTFISSSEYIDLPILDQKNNKVTSITTRIFSEKQKLSLLLGHPGSGKSFLMHKLLDSFGGLGKSNEGEMIKVITTNNAIPILINLKNCVSDSLESIVRGRKNDGKVNGQTLGFIYLFDGLDELNEENAEATLNQIKELSQRTETKKIIISCRSGNLNKLKTKSHFSDINEYRIADLDESYIEKYISSKNCAQKTSLFKKLKKNNKTLIKEVKDILLIRLFLETIEKLDQSSTILDLFDRKIYLLLNIPEHKKNIDNLNLLNCKKEGILKINQEIAFKFQEKFQFRFPQKDLQNLILNTFSRLDYKSVNHILAYIADLFFDNSYKNSENTQDTNSYIYQHRRYQEYFLTQKLVTKYGRNPNIIRELKILSNHEYFEKLFLPYLRTRYEKQSNLPGLIELNLIDIYLGNHKGFVVDGAYYMNSSKFIPALVAQNDEMFNEIIENDNLDLKIKISIDINELKRQFEEWKKNREAPYYSNDYLKTIWEHGVASLIENSVILWKSGKIDYANYLREQLQSVLDLFKKYKYKENIRKDERDFLKDPFWKKLENWLYYLVVIKNNNIKDLLNNHIRKRYDYYSDKKNPGDKESKREILIKSFLKVCLKEKTSELNELVEDFDNFEFLALLDILKSIEYLPILAKSKTIFTNIEHFVNEYPLKNIDKDNYYIIFYKKFFDLQISNDEKELLSTLLSEHGEKRRIDWHMYDTHIDIALISYILNINSFEHFLKKQEGHPFRYYNESGLYSAIFKDYILLLKQEKKIEAIVRDFTRYINFYYEGSYGKYLDVSISFLWAQIFAINENNQLLRRLKEILIKKDNNLVPFSFFLKLNRLIPDRFSKIVNKSDLEPLENELKNWDDDYPSYVDQCFSLSLFFLKLDNQKSILYFERGVIEGMLRHGWRKDHIVSFLLVDALEILWRNNWETSEKLEEYSRTIFKLAMRVSKITDGRSTWQGPYNVVKLVADYNLDLAEEFKEKLIDDRGYSNFNNIVITHIINSKIERGFSVKEIEKQMNEYRGDSQYNQSDHFEQKITVYLKIAESDFYTEEEKKDAFNKAYDQVEEIKKRKIDYYFPKVHFEKERKIYEKLCRKYQREFNLKKEIENENNYIKDEKHYPEKKFIEEVKQCTNSIQLSGKYRRLKNYKNGIVLKNKKSWEILIQKTFEINNSIEHFINFLMKNNFPHTDWFSNNSRYLHIALAEALKNSNTRQETLKYLYTNSGHGGFVNIMKSYELLDDKQMCVSLFLQYLRFCKLIVY